MSDWTSWLESSVMGDALPLEHEGGPSILHVPQPEPPKEDRRPTRVPGRIDRPKVPRRGPREPKD